MIGRTLSHFRITAKLGQGGMGEVYRAEDTKLGREVAIKVLPEVFTEDSERLVRFEREAKLLASLNHPNIAGIHEVGEDGGVHFLAMELAEGEDLAERLSRGAIPLEEALPVALQIAEALEEAHERGIVHRDLKPHNVKLTPDGRIKVLDFGLAKAFDPDSAAGGSNSHLSNSPTMTLGATVQGVILGTAGYMSPEQAKGLVADKRSDIWAWGVVVVEMLTGRRLFAGETMSETLALVIASGIDLSALPASIPPPLRALLRRCLERDPKLRLRDIGEARVLLARLTSGDLRETAPAELVGGRRAGRGRTAAWVGLAALASLIVGVLVGSLSSPEAESSGPRVGRFVINLPDGYHLTWGAHPFEMAPDDTSIVYSATTGERRGSRLFLQRFERFEPEELPDTQGAESPFFSPDGRSVGFLQDGALRRISLEEGTIGTITDGITIFRGASWGSSDTIVFVDLIRGLLRVPARGGEEMAATSLDGTGLHRFPVFLPDSDDFVFSVGLGAGQRLATASLSGDDWRPLELRGAGARFVRGGFLAYGQDGPLRLVPFEPTASMVTGDPRTVLPDVYTNIGLGLPNFAVSAAGSLAYVPGQLRARLVWVDRTGGIEAFEIPAGSDLGIPATPRLSPDGTRLAVTYARPGEGAMAWIFDLERGTRTPLIDSGSAFNPLWSPDGKRVSFVENTTGAWRLAWKDLETGALEQPEQAAMAEPISWHPDGQRVVMEMDGRAWAYAPGSAPQPLWPEGDHLMHPSFSPDGRWVLGLSKASGRPEVVLRRFPGERTIVVSTDGGTEPAWSPDGREIFYREGKRVLAVPIAFDGTDVEVGSAKVLFQGLYETTSQFHTNTRAEASPNYSASPDGERLLMVELAPETLPRSIHVVTNWWRELDGGSGE